MTGGRVVIFFFQAEDGIRDTSVTGVQTCALPIWCTSSAPAQSRSHAIAPHVIADDGGGAESCAGFTAQKERGLRLDRDIQLFTVMEYGVGREGDAIKIGRASCRERV